MQQRGGTPFPFKYYSGQASNYSQVGGDATPLPPAWFDPNAGPGLAGSQPGCRLSGNPLNFIDMLYSSDRAIDEAYNCTYASDQGTSIQGVLQRGLSRCGSLCNAPRCAPRGIDQSGGADGAPFFIPKYGRNPNQTSGQMNDESQITTGFSYRFVTPPSCAPFCSQWGNNAPSFNPV